MFYIEIMNEDAKILSRNLKKLMEKHGHNQSDLAKKAGLSQKTISNMLNPGDTTSPTLSSIQAVSEVYKIKTWHLLLENCPDEILFNHSIEKLVQNYICSDDRTRNATLTVSEIQRPNYFP